MESYQFKRIASGDANTTVTVCATPCTLHSVTINTTSAQALTLKDSGTNNTNTTIATIKASIAEQTLQYDVDCPTGLTITVPASYTGDVTIAFKPL